MGASAKAQRRRAHRKPAQSSVIRIETKDGIGSPRWVTADLVDVIDGGCGLALMTLLKSGSTVVVRGKLGENHGADNFKAAVRWCVRKTDGTFRAGLEFLERTGSGDADTLDCYEVMQLSPNADADTISRVYRMLAFRYHPDNKETGDSEKFIQLSKAHQILSDPQKRASYDLRHRVARPSHGKVFDPAPASAGSAWEKRRSHDPVAAAYTGASMGSTQGSMCWEG